MHPRPARKRIEALLLLLGAAIAVGIILAAVGRLRDAAARSSCRNNLKQLALAANNFYVAHNALPPLADQGEGAPTGRGLPSAFATLLPYIEASPYRFAPDLPPERYCGHSSVSFTYGNKDGTTFTNGGGTANQVGSVFVCPGDGTADRLRDVAVTLPDGVTGYYAAGSYAVKRDGPLARGGSGPAVPAWRCEHSTGRRAAAEVPDGGRRGDLQPMGPGHLLAADAGIRGADAARPARASDHRANGRGRAAARRERRRPRRPDPGTGGMA
jgi:hypothetical protein